MFNWNFNKKNTLFATISTLIALLTYASTAERKLSFWDCGEYISSAVKLEVTHAPGAAMFQIFGAFMALFAMGDSTKYSLIINLMSATFSALTILFLYLSVVHLGRKLMQWNKDTLSISQQWILILSGLIGALCFTFSDTFWFSAVEGEVYSMASLFIAALFWLILKWENEAHLPNNHRWIILIFFGIGMSVGVHMMVMLVIPAICLTYYAKNYDFTWKNFIIANFITLLVMGFVFKLIFPLIMTFFGKSEMTFVNGFGLPFHSGTIFAFIIMILVLYVAIRKARSLKNPIWQTATLSVVYMVIGFSCWLMIPIRANANPPMNLNDPDNAIGMLDYYNRVQYGDWPTSFGANYTAYIDGEGIEGYEKTGEIFEKDEKLNKYVKVGDRTDYKIKKSHIGIMPRMFSSDRDVMSNYISMYGAPNFTFNYSNPDLADSPEAQKIFKQLKSKFDDGSITLDDYLDVKPYHLINIEKPSLSQNLDYFFSFQNGYYFVRYLLWNFVGRQNDLEGHMENTRGNWASGISIIDNYLLGSQTDMPAKYKNESTVYFYFLPFILGIVGFFFQLNKDFGRFYALLSLFILTSFGIVFYTGMKPFEPRERDYALVGSFYVFAIWIGLGALTIMVFIIEKLKNEKASIAMGAILLGVPTLMGFQNYSVHDRSGRNTAYDFAYSTLKSLPKNAMIFVYGDNDTYPVWGLQETENFRDDVKVVNFTLLATPWNIDQVKRKTYNAMGVPSQFEHFEYREGINDQVVLFSKEDWENKIKAASEEEVSVEVLNTMKAYAKIDSMSLKDAVKFIKNKSEINKQIIASIFGDDKTDVGNFLPTNKFYLPVNKQNAIKAGIIKAKDIALVENNISINYDKRNLFKNELLLMDILANFDWKRSIQFSTGGLYDPSNLFYLNKYLQFDGFSYRFVPIKTNDHTMDEEGRVDADELYNVVKNFRWGNFKNQKMHFDETATQNIPNYRSTAGRAAIALSEAGKLDQANELLKLVDDEIPTRKYNDAQSLNTILYAYIMVGQEKKALELAEEIKQNILIEYDYFSKLSNDERRFVKNQQKKLPFYYSLVTSSICEAYIKLGQKDKAYSYSIKSIEPIDKRFTNFIKEMKMLGKEKAYSQMSNAENIIPFYQYIFEVMKPFDTTYKAEKMSQITDEIVKVTQ